MGLIKILLAWLMVALVWSFEVSYLLHIESTDFGTSFLVMCSLFVCVTLSIGAFFVTLNETMQGGG